MIEILFWAAMGLVWILFGVTGAIIAGDRGGESWTGFAFGALFGPFGLIWAYFMDNDIALDAKLVEQGQRKWCPDCAEAVRPQARICKHCGHDFAELQLKQSARRAG